MKPFNVVSGMHVRIPAFLLNYSWKEGSFALLHSYASITATYFLHLWSSNENMQKLRRLGHYRNLFRLVDQTALWTADQHNSAVCKYFPVQLRVPRLVSADWCTTRKSFLDVLMLDQWRSLITHSITFHREDGKGLRIGEAKHLPSMSLQ